MTLTRRRFMGRIAGATAALVLGLQAPEVKVAQHNSKLWVSKPTRPIIGASKLGKSFGASAEWDPYLTQPDAWYLWDEEKSTQGNLVPAKKWSRGIRGGEA